MANGGRNPFDGFKVEIDPSQVEDAVAKLRERLEAWRQRAEDGVSSAQYTKVRVKYRGRQIGPDLPLAAFLAGEGVALAAIGPIYTLLGNLVGKAVLEVVFVHDADTLVADGRDAYTHGETELAEARYREALLRRKDDPSALYHLGVLLRVTGRADEAMQCFRKAAMGPEGHPDVVRAAEMIDRLQGKRSL